MDTIKKKILRLSVFSIIILLISGIVTSEHSILLGTINGLFISGLIIVIIGLFQFVYNLGLFDIFIYSYRKYRRHTPNFEDELDEPDIGDYHQFQNNKKKNKNYKIDILFGGTFIFASVLLVFVRNILIG